MKQPASRRTLYSSLVTFGLAAVFYAAFIVRSSFVIDGRRYFTLFDDMMISMRYARNLARGEGLVWNPGAERVEGYTNFLWTVVMAIPHAIGLHESVTSLFITLVNAALLLATGWVMWRIARRLAPESDLIPPAAAALTLFYYPLVFWSLRGTEVGPISLLLAAAVLLVLRLRDEFRQTDLALLGAIFVAAVLMRTDTLFICLPVGLMAILFCRSEHRVMTAVVLGGALGGALAGHTAFRLLYYGELLPNTYYLKMEGFALSDRLERGALGILDVLRTHLFAPVAVVLAFCAVRGRHVPAHFYLLGLPFLFAVMYSIYVGGDAWEWMHYSNRYVTPAVPLLLLLSVLVIREVLNESARIQARWAVAGVGLLLVAGISNFFFKEIAVLQGSMGDVIAIRFVSRLAAISLMAVLIAAVAFKPLASLRMSLPIAALAVGLLLGVNLEPTGRWLKSNTFERHLDRDGTVYGEAIKEYTSADATIAVVTAGHVPYFSDRWTIDLMGKSDPAIAHLPPVSGYPLYPGHNKFDYDISIADQRPDFIAQLWTPALSTLLPRALADGYEVIEGDCLVNSETDNVDVDGLESAILPICSGAGAGE